MPDLPEAIQSIQRELGSELLTAPDDPAHCVVNGTEPLALAQPATADELSAFLKLAGEHAVPVVPHGAGCFSHLGGQLSGPAVVLSTTYLNEIIAYEPADLTVTVQAGTTLRALQRRLAKHGQWLPLDPPCTDEATLGGIVAANAGGPSRLRYGTASDIVLGLGAVSATGETLNAGGRVVKNVAGYDLTSLLVGSLGTLAVLTELTFKVWPRPAARLMVLGRCESCEQAHEAAGELIASQLEPTFVELLNANALAGAGPERRAPRPLPAVGEDAEPSPSEHGAAVIAGFAGSEQDIVYQGPSAEALLQGLDVETETLEGAAELAGHAWLRTIVSRRGAGPTGLAAMKLSVLSSDVAKAIEKAEGLAADFDWRCAAQARAGNGVVHIIFESPSPIDEPPERVGALCEALREEAQRLGGWAVIERAPAAVKELVDVWGNAGRQHKLIASIKDALDPAGILSPGRIINAH